eukprot:gene54-78_t
MRFAVVNASVLSRIPDCVWQAIFSTHFDESERQLLSWVSRSFRAYFTEGPTALRIDASVRRFSRTLISREVNFVRRVALVADCYGAPLETYPRKSLGRAIYTSARWNVIEWALLHDEPECARARLTIDILRSVVRDARPFTTVLWDLFHITQRAARCAGTRPWLTTEGGLECTAEAMYAACDVGPNSAALFAFLIEGREAYDNLQRCQIENVSEIRLLCTCLERCVNRNNLETASYIHAKFGAVLRKQPMTIRILRSSMRRLRRDTRVYDTVTFLVSKGTSPHCMRQSPYRRGFGSDSGEGRVTGYGGKHRWRIVFAGLVHAFSSARLTAAIRCRREDILRTHFSDYKLPLDVCELVAETASEDTVKAMLTHVVDARTNGRLHECLGRHLRMDCVSHLKKQNSSALTDFVQGMTHATAEALQCVEVKQLECVLKSVSTNRSDVEDRLLAMRNPSALLRIVSVGAWRWSPEACTRLINGIVTDPHNAFGESPACTYRYFEPEVLRDTLIGMRLAGSQSCALKALADCMTRYANRRFASHQAKREIEHESLVDALSFAVEDSLFELAKTDEGLCEHNTASLVGASVSFGSVELARIIHETYDISLPSMDSQLVVRIPDNIGGCRQLYYLLGRSESCKPRPHDDGSMLVLAMWLEHCVTEDKEQLFCTVCHFFTRTRDEDAQRIRIIISELFQSARISDKAYYTRLSRYQRIFFRICDRNAHLHRSVTRTKIALPCWFTDPDLDLIFTDEEWDEIMRPCRLPSKVWLTTSGDIHDTESFFSHRIDSTPK